MSTATKFSELDLEEYDELKDQDYAPGDDIDTYYTPLACTLEMLESGRRSLKKGDITSALNDLAECCEVLAEEHGEESEKCAEAFHEYGRALLEWARIESDVFEHAMGGFDLGESEEPEVEVEGTEDMTKDERVEVEEAVSGALEENYDSHDNAARIHFEVESEDSESEDDSESDGDSEDSDEGEQEVGEEIFEPSNLELSWEMLELARLSFTKTGQKEQLGEVYLDLGRVSMENQDYSQAVYDFTQGLVIKKASRSDYRSIASAHYLLGRAFAHAGKMSEAEANMNSAIGCLEARAKTIADMESTESNVLERMELESLIQEIRDVVVDHKDMNKEIISGCVLAKLATSTSTRLGLQCTGTITGGSA